MLRRRPRPTRMLAALVAVSMLAGCAPMTERTGSEPGAGPFGPDRTVRVVTTTPLLKDIVTQIGAGRVEATSMVPPGADPHAYEPGLRAIRDIAYADLAVSNYLMLEEHSQIRAIEANIGRGVKHVSVAEGATRYGGEVISLVENAALDTAWVGMRVQGLGRAHGADRSSSVRLRAVGVEGPGAMSAYITETFGNPSVYVNSADGLDESDVFTLPVDAHTHMSWAFTQPGIYRLRLCSELVTSSGTTPMGEGTVTFAVGVDAPSGGRVLKTEHSDITVDVDRRRMTMRVDSSNGSVRGHDLKDVVVSVPAKTLAPVPADPAFRFIARPGTEVYQLPQAVLGRHVHGEIDPHLWMNVRNVKAYAKLLRDELIRIDPAGTSAYRRAAKEYLAVLDRLDAEVAEIIGSIPQERRKLVTSHDSFGYLSAAYGIEVAGVVTPNPSVEPSVADRSRLIRTLRDLKVPAVFVTPTELRTRSTLVDIAEDAGVRTCPLLSDTLTAEVRTYVDLMRFDAHSLRRCLT